MARSLNKVMLIGNLGRDPEMKYTPGGKATTTFSIAVSSNVKVGEAWEEKTDWVRCVAWDRLAETCNEYLHKGSKVYVEGRLRTYTYTKDGVEKNGFEITLNEMIMLDNKGGGDGNGRERSAVQPVRSVQLGGRAVAESGDIDDADLPF